MKYSVPNARCPTWLDSAKNGPSTSIWVLWARIAAVLASRCALASTSVVTSSSGTPKGRSSAESAPKKFVWPLALRASIPACRTDFGNAVQYSLAACHTSPSSGAYAGSPAASKAATVTRWACTWSGWPYPPLLS